MDYVELEIGIFRSGDSYAVDMRFRAGETATDLVLARHTPIALTMASLYAVELDRHAYGRQLAAALFGERPLREAWNYARTYSSSFDLTLRVHLRLDVAAPELHQICWEALCDPISGEHLGLSEQVTLVRSFDHPTFATIRRPARAELTALALVANPTGLQRFALTPIDGAAEIDRLRRSLAGVEVRYLDGREGRPRATFSAMIESLAAGVHMLYLVCHRTIANGEAWLWFEDDAGGCIPIAERVVAERIACLRRPPVLAVIAACGSAGSVNALGPLLARAGIGAVIAMNGETPMELVRQLLPPFFRALSRDGQIDHALAVARAAVSLDQPWWMPVLWLRMRDGSLWADDTTLVPPARYTVPAAHYPVPTEARAGV